LVEVRPLEGAHVLGSAKGAFVNIITWATSPDEYRSKAKLVLKKLRVYIVDIVRPEPVAKRRKREGDFEEQIEDIIQRVEDNPKAIIYGTFHLYEKDT
jgi:hypothetical protein